MIVLGADTHKRSDSIAAVAAPTGELRGVTDGIPARQRATEASLRQRLETPRAENQRLRQENADLKTELANRLRPTASRGPSLTRRRPMHSADVSTAAVRRTRQFCTSDIGGRSAAARDQRDQSG